MADERMVTMTAPDSETEWPPRYFLPVWLAPRSVPSLTIEEAKRLAQDIRHWLIGHGHEQRDEFQEP